MNYNVTQLGNIGTVMDINHSGQMIGNNTQLGTAFLYNPDPVSILTPGTTALLPARTVAAAINDAGEIAGTAYVGLGNAKAFLQQTSGGVISEPPIDLHATLHSLLGYTSSVATDINNGPGESIGGLPMGRSVVGIGSNGPWQAWQNVSGVWTARSLVNQWSLTLSSPVNTVFINDRGSIVFDNDQSFYLYFAPPYSAYPYVHNPVKFSGYGPVYGFNNNNQVVFQRDGSGGDIKLYWPSGWGYTFFNLGQIGEIDGNGYPCYIPGPRRYLNNQAINNQTNLVVPVVPPPGVLPGGSEQFLYTQFVTQSTVQQSRAEVNANISLGTLLGINNQGWIVGQDANYNTVLLTPQ